jgi:hypothetical protein
MPKTNTKIENFTLASQQYLADRTTDAILHVPAARAVFFLS